MIVMKFGGTSVGDARAIDRVASIVQGRLTQRPVVVVSAMSKVTDTLLTMARAAGAGERKATTTPPANCWELRSSLNSMRNWEPTSRPSTNCCAASQPSVS